MLYLSKLLIKVRSVNQGPLLDFRVEEIFVPRDEKGTQKLLHLNRYIHGHRYDEVEEDHEGQEVGEHLKVLLENKAAHI